jgi:hypothetical protein
MSARTIPELRAELDAAAERFAVVVARGESGPYTALRRFELAEEALDAAVWRQAVESHRSVQQWAEDRGRWSDDAWWHIWRGVLALGWALNERRPVAGFLPSREVAVRPPGHIEKPYLRNRVAR